MGPKCYGFRGLGLGVLGVHMGSCQNYGPFGLTTRCRIITGTQKGTLILTTTHITSSCDDFLGRLYEGFRVWATAYRPVGNSISLQGRLQRARQSMLNKHKVTITTKSITPNFESEIPDPLSHTPCNLNRDIGRLWEAAVTQIDRFQPQVLCLHFQTSRNIIHGI